MGLGEPLARRPLIVEFIGFTGAGKSTIASKLVPELKRRGINVVDVQDLIKDRWRDKSHLSRQTRRFLFHLGYPLRNWSLCRSALRYVIGTKPIRLKEIKWIRHLFVMDWIYKKIRTDSYSKNYELVISGDGLLQIIWTLSLLKETPSRENIHQFLEIVLEGYDIFPVIFNIDANEAYTRMRGRDEPGSRLARLTRDDVVQRLESNRETLETIFEISRARSTFGSLSVTASKKVEENLAMLVCELEARLAEHYGRSVELDQKRHIAPVDFSSCKE